jgi:hypothetical protein
LLQGISVGDEMGFDSGLFDSDCNWWCWNQNNVAVRHQPSPLTFQTDFYLLAVKLQTWLASSTLSIAFESWSLITLFAVFVACF